MVRVLHKWLSTRKALSLVTHCVNGTWQGYKTAPGARMLGLTFPGWNARQRCRMIQGLSMKPFGREVIKHHCSNGSQGDASYTNASCLGKNRSRRRSGAGSDLSVSYACSSCSSVCCLWSNSQPDIHCVCSPGGTKPTAPSTLLSYPRSSSTVVHFSTGLISFSFTYLV